MKTPTHLNDPSHLLSSINTFSSFNQEYSQSQIRDKSMSQHTIILKYETENMTFS